MKFLILQTLTTPSPHLLVNIKETLFNSLIIKETLSIKPTTKLIIYVLFEKSNIVNEIEIGLAVSEIFCTGRPDRYPVTFI